MNKIRVRLTTSITGPGWVLKQGSYIGDIDANGIVWIEVASRLRTEMSAKGKRIGVHASKFAYLEESTAPAPVNQRNEINEKIRAAEKARNERAKA